MTVVVHIHLNTETSSNEVPKPPIEQQAETVNTLGFFAPRIDKGYTVDGKFFNDQVKNTISLSIVAIAGVALMRSETCDYFEKFGGFALIIFSLLLFAINVGQTIKAIAEIWKRKWGNQKFLGLILAIVSLILMLLGVFWGMIGLWKYGFSNTNFLNIPDVCKISSTTSQTKQTN